MIRRARKWVVHNGSGLICMGTHHISLLKMYLPVFIFLFLHIFISVFLSEKNLKVH